MRAHAGNIYAISDQIMRLQPTLFQNGSYKLTAYFRPDPSREYGLCFTYKTLTQASIEILDVILID